MDAVPNFYHERDPAAPTPNHVWYYVYFHGQAEDLNGDMPEKNGWNWAPSDLFLADQPMPTKPGEYRASLYGQPLIVVLSYRHNNTIFGGRAALASDKVALAHVRRPQDWG